MREDQAKYQFENEEAWNQAKAKLEKLLEQNESGYIRKQHLVDMLAKPGNQSLDQLFKKKNWIDERRNFNQDITLNPNDAHAHYLFAHHDAFNGNSRNRKKASNLNAIRVSELQYLIDYFKQFAEFKPTQQADVDPAAAVDQGAGPSIRQPATTTSPDLDAEASSSDAVSATHIPANSASASNVMFENPDAFRKHIKEEVYGDQDTLRNFYGEGATVEVQGYTATITCGEGNHQGQQATITYTPDTQTLTAANHPDFGLDSDKLNGNLLALFRSFAYLQQRSGQAEYFELNGKHASLTRVQMQPYLDNIKSTFGEEVVNQIHVNEQPTAVSAQRVSGDVDSDASTNSRSSSVRANGITVLKALKAADTEDKIQDQINNINIGMEHSDKLPEIAKLALSKVHNDPSNKQKWQAVLGACIDAAENRQDGVKEHIFKAISTSRVGRVPTGARPLQIQKYYEDLAWDDEQGAKKYQNVPNSEIAKNLLAKAINEGWVNTVKVLIPQVKNDEHPELAIMALHQNKMDILTEVVAKLDVKDKTQLVKNAALSKPDQLGEVMGIVDLDTNNLSKIIKDFIPGAVGVHYPGVNISAAARLVFTPEHGLLERMPLGEESQFEEKDIDLVKFMVQQLNMGTRDGNNNLTVHKMPVNSGKVSELLAAASRSGNEVINKIGADVLLKLAIKQGDLTNVNELIARVPSDLPAAAKLAIDQLDGTRTRNQGAADVSDEGASYSGVEDRAAEIFYAVHNRAVGQNQPLNDEFYKAVLQKGGVNFEQFADEGVSQKLVQLAAKEVPNKLPEALQHAKLDVNALKAEVRKVKPGYTGDHFGGDAKAAARLVFEPNHGLLAKMLEGGDPKFDAKDLDLVKYVVQEVCKGAEGNVNSEINIAIDDGERKSVENDNIVKLTKAVMRSDFNASDKVAMLDKLAGLTANKNKAEELRECVQNLLQQELPQEGHKKATQAWAALTPILVMAAKMQENGEVRDEATKHACFMCQMIAQNMRKYAFKSRLTQGNDRSDTVKAALSLAVGFFDGTATRKKVADIDAEIQGHERKLTSPTVKKYFSEAVNMQDPGDTDEAASQQDMTLDR